MDEEEQSKLDDQSAESSRNETAGENSVNDDAAVGNDAHDEIDPADENNAATNQGDVAADENDAPAAAAADDDEAETQENVRADAMEGQSQEEPPSDSNENESPKDNNEDAAADSDEDSDDVYSGNEEDAINVNEALQLARNVNEGEDEEDGGGADDAGAGGGGGAGGEGDDDFFAAIDGEGGDAKGSEEQLSQTKVEIEEEPQEEVIPEPEEEDDPNSSGASESEEDEGFGPPLESADLTWDIQRLMRVLRAGNQTATVIALCAFLDYDLSHLATLGFLCNEGILNTLCNILETKDERCIVGALQVLTAMTEESSAVRAQLAHVGTIQRIVDHLASQSLEIKLWSAQLIGNLSTSGSARRLIRKRGGIAKLVALLQTNPYERILGKPDGGEGIITIQNAATTLRKLSLSPKGRREIRLTGFFALILDLLRLEITSISVPVFGTLANVLVEQSWTVSLASDDFVEEMVKGLQSDNNSMQKSCADCIMNLVESDTGKQAVVRNLGALQRLLKLLQQNNPATTVTTAPATDRKVRGRNLRMTPSVEEAQNRKALDEHIKFREQVAISISGALWKCCISEENVAAIQKLGGLGAFIATLDGINKMADKERPNITKIRMHLAGALAECSKFENARRAIGSGGGISQMVQLLQSTENALLVRVAEAVGNLAREEANNRSIIDCNFVDPFNPNKRLYLNGPRLLFSLLKKPDPAVQAMAAWAACRLLETASNPEEISRELIGGLELIVLLLAQSQDENVLSEVCNLIGVIALDEENLSVMTDYGVVPTLARNSNTPNKTLMASLSFAIGRCCLRWQNRAAFGKEDTVASMVNYLKHNDPIINKEAAVALYELSRFPHNAIEIHQSGGVKLLLPLIGEQDKMMQEAAAGCILNIRKLALANDMFLTRTSKAEREFSRANRKEYT